MAPTEDELFKASIFKSLQYTPALEGCTSQVAQVGNGLEPGKMRPPTGKKEVGGGA